MEPRHIGHGRNGWEISPDRIDLAPAGGPPVTITLDAQPAAISLDLRRSALVVVDMQNNFCSPGGLTDELGTDLAPVRAPIEPLRRLLPLLRKTEVPIVWVNWGVRPDQAGMPAGTIYSFLYGGRGPGPGGPLASGRGPLLQKGSWSAAVIDELEPSPQDIFVDKVRISGFWDTPLDSILRNLDVRTLLFAGVNLDICVYHTLTDASFLGYNCILIEDCCGATSPAFCIEATLWNIKRAFGFVANSEALAGAIG